MIYVKGNLLESPVHIIAHQVNCLGIMGGGIALQIKNKWPKVFEEYKEFIETNINKAFIPVKAILGKRVISVSEFTNLQRGDIIKLNTRVDDDLSVIVGNINKFTATPGAMHDSYAVRIKSIIREEQ